MHGPVYACRIHQTVALVAEKIPSMNIRMSHLSYCCIEKLKEATYCEWVWCGVYCPLRPLITFLTCRLSWLQSEQYICKHPSPHTCTWGAPSFVCVALMIWLIPRLSLHKLWYAEWWHCLKLVESSVMCVSSDLRDPSSTAWRSEMSPFS